MQSEKQPPTSPQDKGTIRKWLPAIALALVIHALLLIVFFNSQKDTTANESEAITQTTETATASEDLEHEKEVLLTLIEERSSTDEEVSDEDKTDEKSDENSSDDTESGNDKKDEATKSESDSKADDAKKENDKEDKGSNKDKSEPVKSTTQNSEKQQNTNPPLDSSAYTPQPVVNPNDAVLLPRDLPKVEQNPLIGSNDYANTAQQSQDLSDQLSSAVNEIKEQKLREIEMQQQASRAAYLKNNPAPTQSEATEPISNSVE